MSTGTALSLDAQICASEETNRLKGFLGTAGEMTAVAETIAPHSVAWVKSLSDAELLPLGERALTDIADDILILDEIRQRFRTKGSMMGYSGWREFVEKNSRYSVRTIQNRLAEKNGKDESKVNHTTGNQHTREVAPNQSAPNSFRAAQEQNRQNQIDRKASPNADYQLRLSALQNYGTDYTHVLCQVAEAALAEDVPTKVTEQTIGALKIATRDLNGYLQKFESKLSDGRGDTPTEAQTAPPPTAPPALVDVLNERITKLKRALVLWHQYRDLIWEAIPYDGDRHDDAVQLAYDAYRQSNASNGDFTVFKRKPDEAKEGTTAARFETVLSLDALEVEDECAIEEAINDFENLRDAMAARRAVETAKAGI